MEVMYLLIGFSLLIALTFLGLFFWAVNNNQYDDSYTPSVRVLFDNKKNSKQKQSKPKNHRET